MKRFLLTMITSTLLAVSAAAANSIYEIPLQDIDGKATSLKMYSGQVMLLVNVASKCGYTPQYAGLEALYKRHGFEGLVVCGFPCNQFHAQEPGDAAEIKAFCTGKYDVTFPLFAKIDVNGEKQHPLYAVLTGTNSPFSGKIKWNFTKFLVGRDGKILHRFEPGVNPDSAEMTQAIAAALAAK